MSFSWRLPDNIAVLEFRHWRDVGQSHQQVRLPGLLGYKGWNKRLCRQHEKKAVQSVGRNKSDSKNFQQFSAAAACSTRQQRQLIAANSCQSTSRPSFIAATSHSSSQEWTYESAEGEKGITIYESVSALGAARLRC